MTKTLLQSALLAGAGMLAAGSASAVTTTSGPVEQYLANGTTTYIYVSPPGAVPFPGFYYYCSTVDPDIARAIVASLHKNVYMQCNGAAWPAAGTVRYGGVVNFLYAN